jgi:hypothetical protein
MQNCRQKSQNVQRKPLTRPTGHALPSDGSGKGWGAFNFQTHNSK